MKNFYLFLIACFITLISFAQTSIYLEEFSLNLKGYNTRQGTVNLNGVDWTIDISRVSNADLMNQNFKFRTLKVNNIPLFLATRVIGGADWISPVIDISNDTDVSFTIDISQGNGNLEATDIVTTTYSIDGGPFLPVTTNGVLAGTIAPGTIVSQASLNGATLQIKVTFISDDNNDRHQMDNVSVLGFPKTYIFNSGSWSPSDPNGNATNENRGEILVTAGDAVISADTNINTFIVNPGASLTVDSGATLTVGDATDGLTLESTSASYSSLINNGAIVGTINYERFVNAIGSGATGTGGNDLISAPVGTDNAAAYLFQDLLNYDNNINLIANNNPTLVNGTQFAFAPYNNTTVAYENYVTTGVGNPPAPSSTQTIVAGKGYRVATTGGANVSFTGGFSSATVGIAISSPSTGSQWNLIGNPYPSYISSIDFLSTNTALLDDTILDPAATAIYGYNSGTYSGVGNTTGNFTIINNNTNSNLNIAPGQGFFVASSSTGGNVQFLPSMRTTSGTDDFIEGRSAFQNYKLILDLESATTFSTSFYFNENSSLGLDPGYDAAAFGENANNSSLYSHLVEDNTGRAMSMQSLGITDFEGTVIPLGVNSSQGTQITFNINETTLPNTVQVYLEDKVANTLTLLNTSDYVLTPTVDLSGTGRFFLRFAESALSDIDNSLDALNIYTNATNKTIVIAGQLSESTTANIYDLQGRLVTEAQLETSKTSQSIDVSNLSTGVYVIQLTDASTSKSQKLIIR